jgi:hypothetical protein
METTSTFNVRLVTFAFEGMYRVHVRGSDLFFIQLAASNTWAEAVVPLLGPAGLLIAVPLYLTRRAKRKAEPAAQLAPQENPELLLAQNKNNFRVYSAEICEAAIEPPSRLQIHGKQAGRWNLVLRDGRKMRSEFENANDMKAALNILPRLLDTTLKVNVEWDETRKRFQKKKRPF